MTRSLLSLADLFLGLNVLVNPERQTASANDEG
jgi:hypothetical protein